MTVQKHSIDKCLISLGADVQPKFTEVIVIGNGPSALNLSFILSGYRPFYEGNVLENTNEMLHCKLSQQPLLNILDQDLSFLSEGLEGQVTNPMALLFDKLTNPGADVGMFSQSALSWRRTNEEAAIPHVVLGKGKVGGTWQTMDRSMKTLSEAFLLQMPAMPIHQWLGKYRSGMLDKSDKSDHQSNILNTKETKPKKDTSKSSIKDRHSNDEKNGFYDDKEIRGRVSVEEMCAYFEEFVDLKGLSKYFMNDHFVVGVRKVSCRHRRSTSGCGSNVDGCCGSGSGSGGGGGGGGRYKRLSGKCKRSVDVCDNIGDEVDGAIKWDKVGDIGADEMGGNEVECGDGGRCSGGEDGDCNSTKTNDKHRTDMLSFDKLTKHPKLEEQTDFDETNEYNELYGHLTDNTQIYDNTDIIGNFSEKCNHACDNENGDNSSSGMGSYDDICYSSVDNDDVSNDDDSNGDDDDNDGKVTMWEVYGTNASGEQFCYRAPRLVLATGSSDQPNRLGVRGEGLAGIVHSQAEFHQHVKKVTCKGCWGYRVGKQISRRLFRMVDNPPISPFFQHPVVIVGSGLSAADAVLYALERKIPVIHVFEKSIEDLSRTYTSLSPILYPEYATVFDLMTQKVLRPGLYQNFPGVQILAFLDDKQILIQECDRSTSTTIRASLVTILIGSSPNLSFLPDPLLSTIFTPAANGSHKQLISVDATSYENHKHTGLYAMGPLVGENYVRFLGGGAFAISSHIIKNVKTLT